MSNPCEVKVKSAFPGALTNAEIVEKVKSTLTSHGFGKNSLLATSLCCDEVNRVLEKDLAAVYGDNFSMGGLAGFPFGGITSFGAMAHHIPTGGSCLIVYGPHVGVDSTGVVGKVDRRGRPGSGACCGSATAAAGYVKSVTCGDAAAAGPPTNSIDAQQTFVGSALLPYGERLEKAEEPTVELPLALFDGMDKMMKRIVAAGCGEVGGNGKIALLGGIQINTPEGTSDYFLPKVFELRNNTGDVIETFSAFSTVPQPAPSVTAEDIVGVLKGRGWEAEIVKKADVPDLLEVTKSGLMKCVDGRPSNLSGMNGPKTLGGVYAIATNRGVTTIAGLKKIVKEVIAAGHIPSCHGDEHAHPEPMGCGFFKLWKTGKLEGITPPEFDSEQGRDAIIEAGGVYEKLAGSHTEKVVMINMVANTTLAPKWDDQRFVVDAWVAGKFNLEVPSYLGAAASTVEQLGGPLKAKIIVD